MEKSPSALGPEFTMRYNLYRCAQLNVTVEAAGLRSGQPLFQSLNSAEWK